MKTKYLLLYLLLATVIAGLFVAGLVLHQWPEWRWVHEPFHSAVEALGGFVAIFMSWVLLQRKVDEDGGTLFPVAMAFLGMGLLDSFHAMCPPGQAFVFLHSVAGLAGGVGFALVWQPGFGHYASQKTWTPWLVVGGAALLGLWTMFSPETLPTMIHNGEFTTVAIGINELAGVLFLAAGLRFILDFHRSGMMEAYLFACLALLFGLAELDFMFSALWDNHWWLWHMLRLAAYLLVFGLLASRYQRIQQALRRHSDELEGLVEERTAELTKTNEELERAVAVRKESEKKEEYLNLVLRAIRSVNRLIAKEKDRDRLLQSACDNLVLTRGYFCSWIALLDESGNILTAVEAGMENETSPFVQHLQRGELPPCAQLAMKKSGVVAIEDRALICTDCSHPARSTDTGFMTIPMEHKGRVYGILTVSMPRDLTRDTREHHLFSEVADDIAFALHAIELEEVRTRMEEELKNHHEKLEELVEERSAELERTNKVTQAINEVLQAGLKCETDVEVARICLTVAEELTCSKFGFIGEINEAGLFDTLALSNPGWDACSMHKSDAVNLIKGMELRGVWATVLKEEKTIITNDPASHPDSVAKPEGHPPITAFIGVPLKQMGKTFGMIALANKEGGYESSDQEALNTLSSAFAEIIMRKRAEISLREARVELIRKERLAVLGQLSGGVGHELRNPLGVISNAVYYLNTITSNADETMKEYLTIISSEVQNADKIVGDLLDLSRTRPASREETAVADLVAQVLEKEPPPENIAVATEMSADLAHLFVDPRQIGQVMANVIKNAFQAMPEGGTLTIAAEQVAIDDSICIHISDTGCGIPKENLDKVFEPLFTSKARGIGLGMTVSKNLVEVNNGHIEVESEEGKGTTFHVVLPTRKTPL